MKAAIVDHTADIEQLLGNLVLNLLQLSLYVVVRVLLYELLHFLVYLRLCVVGGVFLQVLGGHACDHILNVCIWRETSSQLIQTTFHCLHVLFDRFIHLIYLRASIATNLRARLLTTSKTALQSLQLLLLPAATVSIILIHSQVA